MQTAINPMAVWGTPGGIVAETILPEQFRPSVRIETPESRLILAVLENALDELKKPGDSARQRRQQQEAAEWIMQRDAQWFFSFENICTCLGIDADAIRAHYRPLLEQEEEAA